jgi:bacillopeptidase F
MYNLEANYDYGYIEISLDAGDSWTQTLSFSGNQPTWIEQVVDLSILDGGANARLRFRLESDQYISYDGWHIDDITITGSSPGCYGLLEKRIYFPLVIKS